MAIYPLDTEDRYDWEPVDEPSTDVVDLHARTSDDFDDDCGDWLSPTRAVEPDVDEAVIDAILCAWRT